MPTTPEPARRRLLPLFAGNHAGGRSPVTCRYRCADACLHEAPNTSDNAYFGDVVRSIVDRRGALKAGAVIAAAGAGLAAFGGTAAAQTQPRTPANPASTANPANPADPAGALNFTPVAPNTEDAVVIPDGYEQSVLIRWGDPVLPGAPRFDFTRQTAAAQAKQFGYNNDFCGLVPVGGDRWLMGSNHEYTTEVQMHLDYDEENPTEEQVKIAWAAHGFSVVLVRRDKRSGKFLAVPHPYFNRRLTARSEFTVDGPAAGSDLLRTSADPSGTTILGTIGNCAGGVTPWGTILTAEENFNGYFAGGDAITDPTEAERVARYGTPDAASTRKWERFDDRFDLAKEPNEFNRFGWIVEIDPREPRSTPVKHTALGRFKHEGATIQIAKDGRAVAYMGDDERFDYIYKFVSKNTFVDSEGKAARERNKKLLSEGTLYVARFTGNSPQAEIDGSGRLPADGQFDGTGEWLPLASTEESFVDGFSVEEVFVFARLAADKAGATKMDRPEDIEPNPVNGRIYAALTNNSDRGPSGAAAADEPNPRNGNKHGHILEWDEDGGDHTATSFAWRLLLVCGDPNAEDSYFGGYDKSQVSPISCPDNVAFDKAGNLWISTDGNELGSNDGLFQVPVDGPERGRVRQFLTVPVGAETCGPVIGDDFVLVSVQHPGENAESAAAPTSHWPDGGDSQPRPSVVAVWPS
ncbi:hypothetical protein EV191_1011324 [Tamaricihabitans halophyticus]|uniref:Channel forming colicins domain-containing protein n=1 Tax=Tamaricihabitans halophyticus TaxID=1262583 RepID=A0A4R2R688_9PSEU|nr:hypothetical protein EV191_1011324 [Tamaricihabitans halophyticus]